MNPDSKTELSRYTPDELRELYKKNPELFNQIAADSIRQACTGSTPEQTIRRRQMQWAIEAQLRKAKTPLGRMQIMESIFYGRVFGADGELAHLMNSCMEVFNVVSATRKAPTRRPALTLVKR